MYKSLKPFARFMCAGAVAMPLLCALTPNAQAASLTDGLVAYWNFNDGNANDTAGGPVAFNGTEQGGASYADGRFGSALQLSGTGQSVVISGGEPDDLSFEGGSMSLAGWFKVDGFDKSWQALAAKGEGNNWRLARRGSEGGIAWVGGNADTPTGPFNINDGGWHHVVAVADKDAGVSSLWVDGKAYAKTVAAVNIAKNGQRMLIGDNPGAKGRNFKGGIDDLALWNRPLSEQEILQLWNEGSGREIKTLFQPTIEILGIGASALLGGDLTDPENDGKDCLGCASDPSWNWVGITASNEPDFQGGENSFNIFDNKVGGGNDKWCCDDPTPGKPVWVAVQFPNPVALTHFTITSGNDTPGRDPVDFAIQGSNDGATYEDIYHMTPQTNPTVPWTARNQVVKFTLPFAAAPYRYIRYIAYDTPANLHQINEIEYFGNIGGSQLAFISGVQNTIDKFSFRLTDAGDSKVQESTVKLNLDGSDIALGALTKVDGIISAAYVASTPFLPGSVHNYVITAKDGFNNVVTTKGSFTTTQYALLTADASVTPNEAAPGFIWNVHQNDRFQDNNNTRPIRQLAGKLGENRADANAQGGAIGAGTPSEDPNGPVSFEVETVINFNQTAGNAGSKTGDAQMPGIPGLAPNGGNNGIAAEIITYISLPKGLTQFIVNSDDGFLTTAGDIADVLRAKFAGEFNGGRGASDTVFPVYAAEAGVYGFRTIYEEGGGGANIEILTVAEDGSHVLVNDLANGGLPAYRAVVSADRTLVTAATPVPGSTGVSFLTPISVTIKDGADAVDASSVKLSLDGVELAAAASKNNGITTITFQPTVAFAPLSKHKAGLSFKYGANTRSDTWNFQVTDYATLTTAHQAVSVDKSQPGFSWNVWQNNGYTHTSLAQTEQVLAGIVPNDGNGVPWANLADPAHPTIALGEGTPGNNGLIHFEIPGVINMSQGTADNNGNFRPDDQMPGIPGTAGGNNGIDAEIITFVELPAGAVTLGVNSDDGFRTQGGFINVPADGVNLGQFDGGRGASDTIFTFLVQSAGVYPLRTIYQEGGGGANIEIFSVNADGSKVLLNDVANGGYAAYRAGVAPDKSPKPKLSVVRNANGTVTVTFEGTLEVATKVEGPYTPLTGVASPLTVPADQAAQFARARR